MQLNLSSLEEKMELMARISRRMHDPTDAQRDTSSPSPCSQQQFTFSIEHTAQAGFFLLIFHNKFLSLQCSKCHGIKRKVLVLTERNNMVFYLMQNDDFIIEKYGLQGRLVQRFSEKINAKKLRV